MSGHQERIPTNKFQCIFNIKILKDNQLYMGVSYPSLCRKDQEGDMKISIHIQILAVRLYM